MGNVGDAVKTTTLLFPESLFCLNLAAQDLRHLQLTLTQGLQVCKWYLLWGLKSMNRTYFGLFGAPGFS